MDKQEKIKWGDRVRTTSLALEKNIFKKHQKGICVGRKYALAITVIREGQVTPCVYSINFWKKDK